MYVCLDTYIYIYIYICTHTHTRHITYSSPPAPGGHRAVAARAALQIPGLLARAVSLYLSLSLTISLSMYMYMCMCIYIYIYTHVCVCIMCVYIYIYIHTLHYTIAYCIILYYIILYYTPRTRSRCGRGGRSPWGPTLKRPAQIL